MPKYRTFDYKCSTCETEQKHYAWDNEVTKQKQTCIKGCKKKLTNKDVVTPVKIEVAGIRTDTKNRV